MPKSLTIPGPVMESPLIGRLSARDTDLVVKRGDNRGRGGLLLFMLIGREIFYE